MAASKKRPPHGQSRAASAGGAVAHTPAASHTPAIATALFAVAIGGLLFPPLPNQPLGMDLIAAWAGLGGLLASVVLLAGRGLRLPRSGPALAWTAFMGWALVGALASGRVWAALVGEPANRLGWMTLVALTAIALAASTLSAPVKRLLKLHSWWIVLAEASFTLYRLTATHDSTVGGTLPNSTDLGQAFVLLLPWVLPDASVTNAGERRMRYATIAIAIFTLAATQSRAALVIAGVWVVWALARRWKVKTAYKVAAFALLAALAAVAAVSFTPVSIIDPDGSLPFGGRLAAWQQSGLALAERPVLGWGPDGYWPGAASIRTQEVAEAGHSLLLGPGASDPHNVLIWIAVSTGVVGFGLALWFGAGIARGWRRAVSADPDVASVAWAVAGCLAIGLIAPIALHVLPLLAVVLGTGLRRDVGEARVKAKDARTAGAAIAVGLALVCAIFAFNALSRAQFEVAGADRSPGLASQAGSMRELWALDAHMAYLASLHAGWAAQTSPAGGWQDADLEALEEAIARDSRNPFYALERARAMRYYLLPAESIDAAFEIAFARYPGYPLGRAEYAAYLAEAGRIADARAELDAISAIDDEDPARVAAVEAAQAAIAAAK